MPENTEKPSEKPQQTLFDQVINRFTSTRDSIRLTIEKLSNIEKSNMETGIRHFKSGNYFDAQIRFKFATYLNKNNAIAHYLLGKSFFYRGKFAESVPHLRTALGLKPDLEEARFLLAAAGSREEIKSIPRSFVIEKLDFLSTRYDNFIETTSSHLNAVLEKDLRAIIGETMGFNVLDLGGRGGDSAQVLRSVSNAVIGVEPSIKLVALARNRRINDLLTFNQIIARFPEDYLKDCKDTFAIVLSTYYLDNLGDLSEYFRLVHKVLEDGGIFAFNISRNTGPEDYIFNPKTLIFTHSDAYIKKLAEATGFGFFTTSEVKYPNQSTDLVYILEKK